MSVRGAPGVRAGHTGGGSWRVFEAIFQPGRVRCVHRTSGMALLSPAATAVCRALMNADTPLWTDAPEREQLGLQLRARYGIPPAREPAEAAFALVTAPSEIPALHRFRQGTEAAPERSTTLVIEVARLIEGTGRRLTGPGIETEMRLQVSGLEASFWGRLRAHNARCPYGIDVILTCGRRLAALPRWTTVET